MDKKTRDLIKTFNVDQAVIFGQMQISNKLQICLPTGVGKGYLMGIDIRNRLLRKENVIAIASHRLILNTQHMDDLIVRLSDMMGNVRFVFVGSEKYDHGKLYNNSSTSKLLYESHLSSDEIIKTCLNENELLDIVNKETNNGNKVVIISTYHSLDKLRKIHINTLYADEAHTLASNENLKRFEQNYRSLSFDNSFFFTATPKDCSELEENDSSDLNVFLMNNEDVFGERVGMTMTDAIQKGYITRPIIHIAIPKNYQKEDMDNVKNKVKFIIDTFSVHTIKVKESSSHPELIEPKILIKCENVAIMWEIYDQLLIESSLEGVDLYAGASSGRRNQKGALYEVNGDSIDKKEHLKRLKNLKNIDKAIVLHVDTLSEGVNVKGFTGVMFLTDRAPSIIKLLQNIGRGTRILDIDRKRLIDKEINTSDYRGWVKPNTFVILPVYSPESEVSQENISETIKKVRDKSGYTGYVLSIGDDVSKGINKNDNDKTLTDDDLKDPRKKLVKEIDHKLEKLYMDEKEIKELNRLNNMTDKEKWEEFILSKMSNKS